MSNRELNLERALHDHQNHAPAARPPWRAGRPFERLLERRRASGRARLSAALASWALALVVAPAGVAAQAAQSARAETTIALPPLSGPSARPLGALLARELRAHGRVLDADVVAEAMHGEALTTRAARAQLARRAGAQLVVLGESRGRRGRTQLTLAFYDATGSERASGTISVRPGRRGRRAISRELARLIDDVGPLEAFEASAASEAPAPSSAGHRAAVEAPSARPAVAPRADESLNADAAGTDGPARPWLRVHAGLGLRNRSFTARTSGSRELRHDLPLYPELLLSVSARPLASLGEPLLSGIVVRGRFEHSLLFESETPAAQVVGGAAWGLSGEVGWMAPLEDSIELGAFVGGGFSSYGLDDNAFIPTVEYAHLSARAAMSIRILDELLVLGAEGGYQYVIGGGPLAATYGSDLYGHGMVAAGRLGGAIPIASDFALDWGVEVEWQHTWLSFGGTATEAVAASGNEEAVRARLLVGVAFQ